MVIVKIWHNSRRDPGTMTVATRLTVQKGETPKQITACLLWMVPQSVRILELLGNKQLFRFPFDAPEVLVTQGVLLVTK